MAGSSSTSNAMLRDAWTHEPVAALDRGERVRAAVLLRPGSGALVGIDLGDGRALVLGIDEAVRLGTELVRIALRAAERSDAGAFDLAGSLATRLASFRRANADRLEDEQHVEAKL